jgi:hypothetical protein
MDRDTALDTLILTIAGLVEIAGVSIALAVGLPWAAIGILALFALTAIWRQRVFRRGR